jgi:hypothetical protein
MSTHWDCFVDEVKDGGVITGLGALIVEVGVLEGFAGALNKPIAKRTGKGAKVGKIHWSSLKCLEASVAKEWLTHFFSGSTYVFRSMSDCSRRNEIHAPEASHHHSGG